MPQLYFSGNNGVSDPGHLLVSLPPNEWRT
jgi:hypothetical protein